MQNPLVLKYNSCERSIINVNNVLSNINTLIDLIKFWIKHDNDRNEIPCDNGWVYDRTTFGSSAVMEWNLVSR